MANIGNIVNGYKIIRELNVGNYCSAYEVIKNGKVYFLKEYSDPTKLSSDYNSFIENQNKMIPKLNMLDSNIEKIVEVFEANYRYCQVKEFISGQSLRAWMLTHPNFTVRKSLSIAMCHAVNAIHKVGIIHQDLKPDQFMVIPNNNSDCGFGLVLTDFDWSVINGKVVRHVGTPLYSNIDSNITYKTDIFTLGIMLSELLIGRSPYIIDSSLALDEIEMSEYWKDIVSKKHFEHPIKLSPHNITPEISSIIVRCLDPEPNNRPEINEILFALEFDKLRFVPLVKSIFVPIPKIETHINIAVVKKSPLLTDRIKNYKIKENMVNKHVKLIKMPTFETLNIEFEKESILYIIQRELSNFRNIVANLIKPI